MKTIDPREFEISLKIKAAKERQDIEAVKKLTEELIVVQRSYPVPPRVPDDVLVSKLGVKRELLDEEHKLVAEIDNAIKDGDTSREKELRSRLSLIQREQPQVGPRFG